MDAGDWAGISKGINSIMRSSIRRTRARHHVRIASQTNIIKPAHRNADAHSGKRARRATHIMRRSTPFGPSYSYSTVTRAEALFVTNPPAADADQHGRRASPEDSISGPETSQQNIRIEKQSRVQASVFAPHLLPICPSSPPPPQRDSSLVCSSEFFKLNPPHRQKC